MLIGLFGMFKVSDGGGGGCRVTGGGEEPPVYPLSDIYDVPVSAPLGRNACHLL